MPKLERFKEWLDISTEGFAQRQEDRDPAHLVKELIQNALDATEDIPGGRIDVGFVYHVRDKGLWVMVKDNGPGVENFKDLRTVFSTSKTESYFLRGRLGQGLKEILCLAKEATITSRDIQLEFHVIKGQRVMDKRALHSEAVPGTTVHMLMPWDEIALKGLVAYLHTFIVPPGRTMFVNLTPVARRAPAQIITCCTLKTEMFKDSKWVRRSAQSDVHLVPIRETEVPMIYEMGIPICEAEWPRPFHLDVQMRVPMNPRRDAVASGYLKELYAAVLPAMLESLEAEDLRDEWVSEALEGLQPDTRALVVKQALGENAVRSVPTLGRQDFDSDARELGFEPINTALLPQGMRTAAREILPTSRDVEVKHRASIQVAALKTYTASAHEERVKIFYGWMVHELLGLPGVVKIIPDLTIDRGPAGMAWTEDGELLLNADAKGMWLQPFTATSLGNLVHELAHHNAMHHGDGHRDEVEKMAGRVALLCLNKAEQIRTQFGDLA